MPLHTRKAVLIGASVLCLLLLTLAPWTSSSREGTRREHCPSYLGNATFYPCITSPGTPCPLLVELHGAGGNSAFMQAMSGLSWIRPMHRLYPNGFSEDGTHHTWNAGTGTYDPAAASGVDHVAYLDDLVDRVRCAGHNFSSVIVSGISNGAAMAMRWALQSRTGVDLVIVASHPLTVAGASLPPHGSSVDWTGRRIPRVLLLAGHKDRIWGKQVPFNHTFQYWSKALRCQPAHADMWYDNASITTRVAVGCASGLARPHAEPTPDTSGLVYVRIWEGHHVFILLPFVKPYANWFHSLP